jgi:hypothetical protein
MLLILTLILALFPQYAWGCIGFIVLGEVFSKTSIHPRKKIVIFEIELAFCFFSIYVLRALGSDIISLALLLATLGLSLSHSLVHKYNIYRWSVLYRVHHDHHIPSKDPEKPLRTLLWNEYVRSKLKLYLVSEWTVLDYLLVVILLFYGIKAVVAALLALTMVELIGFCQHTIDNRAVNCYNYFMNSLSDDSGLHSKHHGEVDSNYSWKYGAMTGLLASGLWILICCFLRVLLLFPWPKANIPGAYLFGFAQNVGNYVAANGRSVANLLHRVPSIFEQPTLLFEYLVAMIRKAKIGKYKVVSIEGKEGLKYSHGICQNRNIYMFGCKPSGGDIIIFRDTIIEGHHRYAAGYRNNMKEIESCEGDACRRV